MITAVATLSCDDGSVLAVLPVPVLDRDGRPYEVTLRIERNGEPFGDVGERCGYFLAAAAARLRQARDAGDDFPDSSLEAGLRSWAVDTGQDPDPLWAELQRYLPRDRELFCFRARDPDDLSVAGELRATMEVVRRFAKGWQVESRAVLHAWGSQGHGVRAVLTSDQLLAFLEDLVAAVAAVGAGHDARQDGLGLGQPGG